MRHIQGNDRVQGLAQSFKFNLHKITSDPDSDMQRLRQSETYSHSKKGGLLAEICCITFRGGWRQHVAQKHMYEAVCHHNPEDTNLHSQT
jgi:hypothetical protein